MSHCTVIDILKYYNLFITNRAEREQDNTIFSYLYCLALVNSRKFLSCLGLFSQYKKYYRIVLKFLFILGLRRHVTVSKSLIKKDVFEISNVHNQRNINLKFVILIRIRLNGFSGDCKSKK